MAATPMLVASHHDCGCRPQYALLSAETDQKFRFGMRKVFLLGQMQACCVAVPGARVTLAWVIGHDSHPDAGRGPSCWWLQIPACALACRDRSEIPLRYAESVSSWGRCRHAMRPAPPPPENPSKSRGDCRLHWLICESSWRSNFASKLSFS